MEHSLVYQSSPIVTVSSNTFINVPVILKYEDTSLIEIIREESIGFTTQIPIFHSDGTYLAKVKGNRVFPTPAGAKANILLEHPMGKTICKLGNKILFEISHGIGDQFKADAELYTPDGYFVRCTDSPKPELIDLKGSSLKIGGIVMSGCTFQNLKVGIWLKKDGSCALGIS
jgi:hypothetical protein